jgi:predicted nucleic acid-binding protein
VIVGLDTSFLVELLRKQAPRHVATRECYEAHHQAGTEFVVAEHALLEGFAVLSRSPEPAGVPPHQAQRILQHAFRGFAIAPVRKGLAWEAIQATLSGGAWGGRVYDAIIALSCYEAGARLILTWNVRHFRTVAPPDMEVSEPYVP